MGNPARKDAGVGPTVSEMIRNAQRATAGANIVKIEIFYNLETGQVRLGAPMDFVLFHGVLEAAKDTFKLMMAEETKKRIAAPNGALSEEARP